MLKLASGFENLHSARTGHEYASLLKIFFEFLNFLQSSAKMVRPILKLVTVGHIYLLTDTPIYRYLISPNPV
jgi:hypothetical protein